MHGMGRGGKGETSEQHITIFIQTYMEDSETYTRRIRAAAASGPSQHTHGPSPAPSRCLSCSPIVGYFLFGAVGLWGGGGCSSQPQVPTVFIHIVNSTSSSPIKQASQAWLYIVVSK